MADYIDVNSITLKKEFKEKINEAQKKATEERKLFDYRCAKIDFEDMLQRKVAEFERAGIEKSPETNKTLVDNFDLSPYFKENRFKLIGKQPIKEKLIISGVTQEVITGEYENWVCKERGCGVSIQKPVKQTPAGGNN